MTIVRFAMLCDGCGERSEEYRPWLVCRECEADICPSCATAIQEPDMDRGSGICRACEAKLVECCRCQRYTTDFEIVEVERQTHWSPAEHDYLCRVCLDSDLAYDDAHGVDPRDPRV